MEKELERIELSNRIFEVMLSTNKCESEFVDECICALTLCLSQIVKSGYCANHWEGVLNVINKYLRQDLGLGEK